MGIIRSLSSVCTKLLHSPSVELISMASLRGNKVLHTRNSSMQCVWLALLPLIAAQSELCPEVTTSKPCSSSQDFVFVVDASFSRLEYHREFQEFLRRFAGGLDLGDSDGPRMSIVSFDGTTTGLPAADVTTIHVSLSSSAADVADAIDELTVPQEICSDQGGCTCISCGIEMAWDVVIAGDKAGRGGFQPTLIVLTDGCAFMSRLCPSTHPHPPPHTSVGSADSKTSMVDGPPQGWSLNASSQRAVA